MKTRLSAEAADAPSRNAQAMMLKENRMGAPAMEKGTAHLKETQCINND
jgi:hypothetical protein